MPHPPRPWTHVWSRTTEIARDPVAWTTVVQLVKTAAAAVVAWVIAEKWLGLPQAFLAPWSAMLVVHFTVHASLTRGLQQMVSAVVGVVLAWAAWHLLGGPTAMALGVALLVGLFLSRIKWIRQEGTVAATTALFVLTSGFGDNSTALIARLADTGIGLGVGLAVNFLIWPPLLDLSVARALRSISLRIGDVLAQIADECSEGCTQEQVEEWLERARELDRDVAQAWALVHQARESGRLNPRRRSRAVRESQGFAALLDGIEQSLSEVRSIARTLGHSVTQATEWDRRFRARWTAILTETARSLQAADAQRLDKARSDLIRLTDDFSDEGLASRHWPEYGGLILNLRNIATELDSVAESDPVSEATPVPFRSQML